MKMNKRSRTIQTGLEIDVKPETDQEILNRLAEAEVAKRKPRGPVQRPQQRRSVPRRVVPRVQPMRGLLAPEPRSSPFMGLLAVSGSKPQ
jgi:Mn-dependent DtxR family transcriptional regulator